MCQIHGLFGHLRGATLRICDLRRCTMFTILKWPIDQSYTSLASGRSNTVSMPFFTLRLQVYYSTQSITKPKAKSNEDSLREIEEAMKKVKEAQSLVSATVDPLMGLLNKRSR